MERVIPRREVLDAICRTYPGIQLADLLVYMPGAERVVNGND